MIISPPWDNDTLLSRWKTPASPAYFKPVQGHIWSASFHPKLKEETIVNWNLLSPQDVSLPAQMKVNNWGLPPLLQLPAGSRYCQRSHIGEGDGTWKARSGAGRFTAGSREFIEGFLGICLKAQRQGTFRLRNIQSWLDAKKKNCKVKS